MASEQVSSGRLFRGEGVTRPDPIPGEVSGHNGWKTLSLMCNLSSHAWVRKSPQPKKSLRNRGF